MNQNPEFKKGFVKIESKQKRISFKFANTKNFILFIFQFCSELNSEKTLIIKKNSGEKI